MLLSILAISLFLLGCTGPNNGPTNLNQTGSNNASILKVAKSVNEFSFSFYNAIDALKEGKENVFFSPLSISQAFSILDEGAKGNTAAELEGVFAFETDPVKRRGSNAALNNLLNAPNPEYQLSVANALWVNKNYPVLGDYVGVVKNFYGGDAANLDFDANPSGSADTINKWCSENTNGKIPSILTPDMVTPDLRLVITNAIYFKGKWLKEFDKKNTKDMEFRKSATEKIRVPMMFSQDHEAHFSYMENDLLQLLQIPYKGDRLSMIVLLPKNDNLAGMENGLNLESYELWKKDLKRAPAIVYLPKFKFEVNYDLKPTLQNMGIKDVFVYGPSDLSGINGIKVDGINDLYVGFALHKAYVDVNEEGTEAAAVTGIGVMSGAAAPPKNPPEFKADHPFIFMIEDKETGQVLFMGKVMDPLKNK